MKLKTLLFGKTYAFRDVKDVLAKANEPKSGDRLAGLAAESAQERVAAKAVLAELLLRDLRENPAVPYEQDEVTRIIQDDLNERIYAEMQNWTVSDLREWILSETTTTADLRRASRGLTSEMVAAVCKLMSDLDLIYAARKIPVTAHCNTTIGLPGTLSCRLQPNHPTDDVDGILASLLEGLSFGAGDAVIGLNPVGRHGRERPPRADTLRRGAPPPRHPHADLRAGPCDDADGAPSSPARPPTSFSSPSQARRRATTAFGFDAATIEQARQLALTQGTAEGPNVLYFETGQGSELSSEAHFGTDQVTMEARCYGFARAFFSPSWSTPSSASSARSTSMTREQVTARRAGGPLHGQAHRHPHGLRRLLHQPHEGRPERHREARRPADGGRAATTSWASPTATTSC